MTAGLRPTVFGKKIVLNIYRKHGYSVSPGANARARAIGQCARGKPTAERKQCFKGNKISGK